jgi:predicted alpha/beta hydrolase family esterase
MLPVRPKPNAPFFLAIIGNLAPQPMTCHFMLSPAPSDYASRFQYHEQDMNYMMITLPGIGGSGEDHWQSLWEKAEPRLMRFQPTSWDEPELNDWAQSLERAIGGCERPPVLVAHSLACLLVAHWAMRSSSRVAGAFLVSVPDPDGPNFPSAAASFRPAPDTPLRFPSLIVASTDDPYGSLAYARLRSDQWQTGLVVVGAHGHINASSGLVDWAQGRALLEAFCASLSGSGQGH